MFWFTQHLLYFRFIVYMWRNGGERKRLEEHVKLEMCVPDQNSIVVSLASQEREARGEVSWVQ